jgi:hypothetical protein
MPKSSLPAMPRPQDVNSCSVSPPKILAIGGERGHNTKINSGVMFINTTALAQHHDGLVAWGVENQFPRSYDQDMILGYFNSSQYQLTDLDQLLDKFNWKVRLARPPCCWLNLHA